MLTNCPLDGITITVRFEETKKPTSAGNTYRQCSDKPKFIRKVFGKQTIRLFSEQVHCNRNSKARLLAESSK